MDEIKVPKKGQIVTAEVIKVEENRIFVDLQSFTEGTIYLDNYERPVPPSFVGLVKVGDMVEAKIMRVSEGDDSSLILLSRLPLLNDRKLKQLEETFRNKTEIKALVTKSNANGLILDYQGFELFLPNSLLDFDLVDKKEQLINQELEVIIQEFKPGKRMKLIASRKPIFERLKQEAYEKRVALRQEELDSITTGDVIKGIVEKIEAHAAAIKFDNVIGMLRISQVSHYRIDKISDVLTLGQEVEVKVIKKEGNRLDLSMKALQKTPFAQFSSTHKVGQKVSGVVVQKLPFGIIVELAKDVKGLLHKNEYAWNPKDNFDSYIKIGDRLDLVILSKDGNKERIALSKKALEENPWLNVDFQYGKDYEVLISEASKDGLKVVCQGVDGFIPSNEVSNDKIKIEDHYQKGATITARVIEFKRDAWILTFSIKRIANEAERKSFEKYLSENQNEDTITLGDLFSDLKK